MIVYRMLDLLTGIIEAMTMFTLYETFFDRRENIPFWIYGGGIVILAALINLCNSVFHFEILNIIGMIVSFFAVSFLYNGRIVLKFTMSVLHYLLIIIIEIIVMFSITLVYNITVAEAVDIPSYRVLGIILSKMSILLIVNAIRINFKRQALQIGTSYWLLFFLMFASSTATVFLIFKLSYHNSNAYMYNLSILCAFGLLFSTFFALYLYERLAKQAEVIRKQRQYEQHFKSQLHHLDEILVTQKQIKKFQHDFSHYIIGLQAYLDHNDCRGANRYIEGLKDRFNSGDSMIDTGNMALDAILSAKKAIAESKKIDFAARIQIPEQTAVDPIDLCVIFGNALDNAIEACDRVSDTEKKISLTLVYQNAAMFCKIVNTAPQKKKNKLMTAKTDKKNHGFGLENIRTTLAKYNSEPVIEYNDTEFVLKFVIFINKQMNNKGPIS